MQAHRHIWKSWLTDQNGSTSIIVSVWVASSFTSGSSPYILPSRYHLRLLPQLGFPLNSRGLILSVFWAENLKRTNKVLTSRPLFKVSIILNKATLLLVDIALMEHLAVMMASDARNRRVVHRIEQLAQRYLTFLKCASVWSNISAGSSWIKNGSDWFRTIEAPVSVEIATRWPTF